MKLFARIHQVKNRISSILRGTCFYGRSEQIRQEETTSNREYTSLLNLRKLETVCFCGKEVDLLNKITKKQVHLKILEIRFFTWCILATIFISSTFLFYSNIAILFFTAIFYRSCLRI